MLGTRIPVYDIGGTWWRRAVLEPDDALSALDVRPSISVQRVRHASGRALQQRLVEHLLADVAALRDTEHVDAGPVGICLGAAINEHSGIAVGAAPLWGPDAPDLDLAAALRARAPQHDWVVVNDVTALALFHASALPPGRARRLAAVTLSTGIALRTLDLDTAAVPSDAVHGLQGEIGHLPARFEHDGIGVHLPCDCGAPDHLSAFCSGPGMARTLEALAGRRDARGLPPGPATVEELAKAVERGEPDALGLLDAFTRPLAQILLHHAVLDPLVELTLLSGGVVQALGEPYRESLLGRLAELGMYQVTDRDPDYFRRRIALACDEPHAGLRGAGLRARARRGAQRVSATRSWDVNARQPVRYGVRYTPGLLDPANDALARAARLDPRSPAVRIAVVDAVVAALYGRRIREYFEHRGVPLRMVPVPVSEPTKNLAAVEHLVREFDAVGLSRRDEPVVAVGGGVLTDVVGLAASLYRRGVPYVRVPTTLIGLVDAGVGVKTAVNFDAHKSRLGSYHAPTVALLDPTFLDTLDRRSISNGLGEILKIALVRDRMLFELLEQHAGAALAGQFRDCEAAELIISLAVGNMLAELEPNLWEAELARLADFGHSFSPKIEMRALPELMHGEAVAIDMVLSCCLSVGRGLMSAGDLNRVLRAVHACGLPARHDLLDDTDLLAGALVDTSRQRGGAQRLPLLTGIGQAVFVHDVTPGELADAVARLDGALSVART